MFDEPLLIFAVVILSDLKCTSMIWWYIRLVVLDTC